jgi:hypothetical protein
MNETRAIVLVVVVGGVMFLAEYIRRRIKGNDDV